MKQLYSFTSCPFAQIIMIAMSELSIEFENIKYKFQYPHPRISESCMRGDTPVLINLDDDQIYTGLYAIRNFINSNQRLYSFNNIEVDRLLWFLEQNFMFEVIYPLYYSKALGMKISTTELQKAHKNLILHLNHLNWIASKDYFLCSRKISWVDLVAIGFILCLDYLHLIRWSQYSDLKTWYMKMKSRKSVLSTLKLFRIIGYKPPSHYFELDF